MEIRSKYPYSAVELSAPSDYTYSVLYMVVPPKWFNDTIILAFIRRLQKQYCSVYCPGIIQNWEGNMHQKPKFQIIYNQVYHILCTKMI